MSSPDEKSEINRQEINILLDKQLSSIDFGDTKISIVLGYPRSDIGKSNLTARLGVLLEKDFTIIKFDGFLNTNLDGRYPARTGPYDFVVYRTFHEHISFGGFHQIISGRLLLDFLHEYGETDDHLMFRPHVTKYFVTHLYNNWIELGKPAHLLIELGGTYLDIEMNIYVIPAIRLLKEIHKNVRFFVLTVLGHNRDHIKSKDIINALEEGKKIGIEFDLIFARKPPDLPFDKRDNDMHYYLSNKIKDSFVYNGKCPELILLPYYGDREMDGYTHFLRQYRDIIFPN